MTVPAESGSGVSSVAGIISIGYWVLGVLMGAESGVCMLDYPTCQTYDGALDQDARFESKGTGYHSITMTSNSR